MLNGNIIERLDNGKLPAVKKYDPKAGKPTKKDVKQPIAKMPANVFSSSIKFNPKNV